MSCRLDPYFYYENKIYTTYIRRIPYKFTFTEYILYL